MLIDRNTVEQARNADIMAFLERHCGFTFAQVGGAYRCKEHSSLAVKSDRRSWYWHSKSVGGVGAIDYLTKIENMPFREAVGTVTGGSPPAAIPRPAEPEKPKPKVLVLPEKSPLPLKLYDYLCTKRGIDSDIVRALMQKGLLYEDRRKNIVFVGHDENGKPRFGSLRGTHGDFRGDCPGSDKRYGFNMGAC